MLSLAGCKPSGFRGVEVNRGAGLYLERCAVCHGQDGRSALAACPPLRESEWLAGPPQPLAAIVLDGLRGPLQVQGRTYQGVMPAWRSVLSDEEIAAILTFLRHEWGRGRGPVSPAEVAAVRQETSARQTFWTEEQVRAMRAEAGKN